jgi:pimeloyl-ACP methyl ester carboxylesterase
MPVFRRGAISIHYEVHGTGHPVLLFAPGGMRSSIAYWDRAPFDPINELSRQFRVIAMDQRNAGRSHAPVEGSHGWRTYTEDHLALLDHLRVDRCHVLGGCIGGSFALSLIVAAPERVTAAVLQQPIGFAGDNRVVFHQLFDSWASELTPARPDVTPAALEGFKTNLYGGDFVFSVSRAEVEKSAVPLLVLRGNDVYHPAATSEEIVRLSLHAELISSWKTGDDLARAVTRVREFFVSHAPPTTA